MAWADRQRAFIVAIVFIIVALFVAGVVFVSIYETPSCGDKKQNQDEEGVDCGGVCAKLCLNTAQTPQVLFARAVQQGDHTDLIAHIENKTSSAKSAKATFSIQGFSSTGAMLVEREISLPIPPTPLIPLYVPSIFSGEGTIARMFVTLTDMEPFIRTEVFPIPKVASYAFSLVREVPRLTAQITYQGSVPLLDIPFVATVFQGDDVVAVSRTVVPVLRGGETTDIVFTWSNVFPYEGARVVILPGVAF